jgi:hypothetical protein
MIVNLNSENEFDIWHLDGEQKTRSKGTGACRLDSKECQVFLKN